jgi:molecular chaperone DnaJ
MKHHPDRNPDDKAPRRNLRSEASLRGPLRRQAARGLRPVRSRGRGSIGRLRRCGARDSRRAGGFGGFADAFGDIFGEIFGATRGRGNGVYRGADLCYNLELSSEEAARSEAKIRIPTMEACETCHGSGCRARTRSNDDLPRSAAKCACRRVSSIQQTCPTCHGTGKVITDPCASCRVDG